MKAATRDGFEIGPGPAISQSSRDAGRRLPCGPVLKLWEGVAARHEALRSSVDRALTRRVEALNSLLRLCGQM